MQVTMMENRTYPGPEGTNTTLGAFSVSFTRPFNTEDTTEDFPLTRSVIDVTWIYGRIEESNYVLNFDETQFGTASIDLREPEEPTPIDPIQSGALANISSGIAALIVLAFMLLVQ